MTAAALAAIRDNVRDFCHALSAFAWRGPEHETFLAAIFHGTLQGLWPSARHCMRRKVGSHGRKDRRILRQRAITARRKAWRIAGKLAACVKKWTCHRGRRHEICRGLHAGAECHYPGRGSRPEVLEVRIYTAPTILCVLCAKMLINCGIARIWYDQPYPTGFLP